MFWGRRISLDKNRLWLVAALSVLVKLDRNDRNSWRVSSDWVQFACSGKHFLNAVTRQGRNPHTKCTYPTIFVLPPISPPPSPYWYSSAISIYSIGKIHMRRIHECKREALMRYLLGVSLALALPYYTTGMNLTLRYYCTLWCERLLRIAIVQLPAQSLSV